MGSWAHARTTIGAQRLVDHLADRGVRLLAFGVQKILSRHRLGRRAQPRHTAIGQAREPAKSRVDAVRSGHLCRDRAVFRVGVNRANCPGARLHSTGYRLTLERRRRAMRSRTVIRLLALAAAFTLATVTPSTAGP